MGDTLVGDAGPLYQPAPETVQDSAFKTDLPAAQDILGSTGILDINPDFSIAMAARFASQLRREGCEPSREILVASRLAGIEVDWVEFDKEHGIMLEGDK